MLEQLIAGTVYLFCAQGIALALGMAFGLALAPVLARRSGSYAKLALAACLGAAMAGVAAMAAFPWLVHAGLWMNATFASPLLLIAGRAALAVVLIAPLGTAIGICGWRSPTDGASVDWRLWLVCCALGCVLLLPAAELGISVDMTLLGAAWSVATIGALRWGFAGGLPAGWPRRCLACLAFVVMFAAPLWRERYDPALAARVLFNTGSFVAYRAGFGLQLLPYVDEARLVGSVEGARGLTTIWKYGANQLQLRENGLPKGLISCDPGVFPRSLSETLPAALPLVLHEKPLSMLLMGLGTGEALSAGLAFPIPEIVCWEPDAAQVRVVRRVVARETGFHPLDDDRVRLVVCDPALALDAERQKFDVVVSSPGHASLLRAQPCFVREFYARAARRLAPEGLFCQRLQTIDLGPSPVATIVRTMQSVFANVLAVETGPGEMLFVATNSEEGAIRPHLVERLERPHVRALLAQSGLDWSVVLNLAAWRNSGLTEFCKEVRRPARAGNSPLAFSLPREVMRWGAKQQELYTALSPLGGKLALWIGADGESPALVRRLSEVTGQRELMAKFNDQYWAYRASLRTQLTKKPRSEIEQVSASSDRKSMHPEDRRRMKYFEALGQAAKTKAPGDIERLLRFESPYDPLLTYFVHFEAAEMYSRSDEPDAARELRHRLYITWFSSPRDASLRNVLATLTLLGEHPQAEPEPIRRWDQLNAALQALQQRWEARGGTRPRDVKATIAELDETVIAAQETMEALDLLSQEAGIAPEVWAARRTVLERNLVRPVKAYRSELLPHSHRKQAKSAAADDNSSADDLGEATTAVETADDTSP